jgi:hypothetical protein
MWLDRTAGNVAKLLPSEPVSPAIQATYRRGILRAKVTMTELTCCSARIDTMETLRPGMTIWITLPGLEAKQADVQSSENFTAEVRFATPLHPAVLDAVLSGRLGRPH